MSERKELLSVSYHSDDDTGMYRVGEIDFGVNGRLQSYIERYGVKGMEEILSTLGHLAWEVKTCFYEIQNKTARHDCMGAKQDNAQPAKCAMLPCHGYYESMCELCINGSCYRKP